MPVPLIVFDGDCAFCTSCVSWAQRVVVPRVAWEPWQTCDLQALGLTRAQCERALQWVQQNADPALATPNRAEGGAAVRLILLQGRAPWPLLGRLLGVPGVSAVVDWSYRLVARHRHRLPGATPACALPSAPTCGLP